MNEQMVALELFVQVFVLGAFMFFLACAAASLVMMIALTDKPEPRGEQLPAASSAVAAD